MISYLKLPFSFDTDKLKADLKKFKEEDWIEHYNKRDYEGHWSVIALRSVGGNKYHIFPDYETQGHEKDTENLDRTPYIKEVLSFFKCDKNTVRLMRLKPGAIIKEHTDHNLSLDDKELRLHIPITTNPGVEFYLNKEKLQLREGECWYLNFNLIHSLKNTGTTDRVHLIIDCTVNDWLKSFFAQAETLTA